MHIQRKDRQKKTHGFTQIKSSTLVVCIVRPFDLDLAGFRSTVSGQDQVDPVSGNITNPALGKHTMKKDKFMCITQCIGMVLLKNRPSYNNTLAWFGKHCGVGVKKVVA